MCSFFSYPVFIPENRKIENLIVNLCNLDSFIMKSIKKPIASFYIVYNKRLELCNHPYTYTFKDNKNFLNMKLPIPIERIYNLARNCLSYRELASILFDSITKKMVLNKKTIL